MEQTYPRWSDEGDVGAWQQVRPISPFRAPVSRAGIIRRGRPPVSAVSVVAPAGYGKTVLLQQWADLDGRLAVPVTLTAMQDDPAALAAAIASAFAGALAPASPGAHATHLALSRTGEAAASHRAAARAGGPQERGASAGFAEVAARPGSGSAVLARTAMRLGTLIAGLNRPFALLIDDADEASNPACQDLLEVVCSRIPAGSVLVAAGRGRQLFLARWRLSGLVLDVGADDLALDGAGIRLVFEGLGAPPLRDSEVERLRQRTEGWAAGVALAAIVARDGGDPLGVMGEDRPLAEFLQRAALAGLDDDDHTFLCESAIFDRVEPAVCDAVLGRTDSAARLIDLEAHGLLLTPTDSHRSAYRYHPLLREFLLGELTRSLPSRELVLRRMAASWFETRGRVPEAIDQLLAGGDRGRSVRLVAERALGAYEAGSRSAVGRWMEELGDTAIESFPPLMVLAGWKAALDGRPQEADHWAALIDGRGFDEPPVTGLPPYRSARAMLRVLLWRHGLGTAVEDATFAVHREPGSSPWRDHALLLFGWTLRLGGDPAGAQAAFTESSRLAAVTGHATSLVLSESELARAALDAADPDAAERHLGRALQMVESRGLDGSAVACLPRAIAARLALRRYDAASAGRFLTAAMRDRGLCTYAVPVLAVGLRVELCRAQLALGDAAATAHLLREIDDILWLRPGLGALEGAVDDVRDDLNRNRAALGPSPLTPAELRLLPFLQTHLTIAEIAARLYVSRNTAGTQIGAIYRKLGVTTRSGAVDRAAELGLLG